MKKKSKLKNFHIETFDGGAYMNFFTKARNHKEALKRLIAKSSDYKHIADAHTDTTIKIKQLK